MAETEADFPLPTCDQALSEFLKLVIEIIRLTFVWMKIVAECFVSVFVPRTEKSVQGKLVVITGAGHGLGKEMATLFAGKGASLALIDINEDNVKDVAAGLSSLSSTGQKIMPYVCDVRSEKTVKEVFDKIKKDIGPIDILINNAGIVACKPFLELTPDAIERTFQVNTFAHFWSIRAVLPDMLERNDGHIVCIASIAGLLGTANLSDYCASKFAVVGMMNALQQELHSTGKNKGIQLTTVCPVTMSTGMFKAPKTRFESIFPVADPTEVAEKAVHSILTDERMVWVPKHLEYFYRLAWLYPTKFRDHLQSFTSYGVDPHTDP